MYSDDGLLVLKTQYGQASAFHGGWTDYVYGLAAFTHPTTGKTYVYAQDVLFGKSERHRIDNMDTIQRQSGSFIWSAPPDLRGYWALDNNLTDLVGLNSGAFNGGTETYAPGKNGDAIDLSGDDDYVSIPYAGSFPTYTISAWVKPANVTSVNILGRTDANGPTTALANQIRINADGKFEHYTPINGVAKVVTGTTTAVANTWYHVAIVAASNGMMRLYVNGHEEGAALKLGPLWWQGDRFHIGNGTPGGFGFFDGLIDDVHIFEQALTSSQIQTMYAGTSPTLTVSATDAAAAEAGANTGTFTITRNSTSGKQTVNYVLGGTATNGVDYLPLSGSVAIADGQSSATVTVTPIDDAIGDMNETVLLTTVSADRNSVAPRSAKITIVDNDPLTFRTVPAWTGSANTVNGNNYGYSASTNHAGGTIGEIGGTFARNDDESYYADTNLQRKLTLDDVIEASGKLTIFGQNNTDGEWFLGHLSSNTADKSIMGIQFAEHSSTSVRFRARMGHPGFGGADGAYYILPNGVYNFEYSYDPKGGVKSYGGVRGLLTIRIYNDTYDQTATADLFYDRCDHATFDAFGIGIRGELSDDVAGATVKMFLDEVNYTGKKDP